MTSIFTQYEYEHWLEGLYGEYNRYFEEQRQSGRFSSASDPRGVSFCILSLMRELHEDYRYYLGRSVYRPTHRITAVLNPRCVLFDLLDTHVKWLVSHLATQVNATDEEMVGILLETYLNALSRIRDDVVFFDAKEAAWDFRDFLSHWDRSSRWRKDLSEVYGRLKLAVREVERFFYKLEAELNQAGAREFSWRSERAEKDLTSNDVREVFWDSSQIPSGVSNRKRNELLERFRVERARCKIEEADLCGLSAWTRSIGDLNLPDPMKPFEHEKNYISGLLNVLGWNIGIDYLGRLNRKSIKVREYPDKAMYDRYIAVVAPLRRRVELNFEYCKRMGMLALQERWASPTLHLYGFLEGIWPLSRDRAEEFFKEFKSVTENTVREMRSRKLCLWNAERTIRGKGISRFAGRSIRKIGIRDDGVTFVVYGTLYKISSARTLSLLDRLIESYEAGDGWVNCKGQAPSSYFRRNASAQFRKKFIQVNGDKARLVIK